MQHFRVVFLVCLLNLFATQQTLAQTVFLKTIRMSHSQKKPRIVFELSDAVHYQIFILSQPDRLVVDFKNTVLSSVFKKNVQRKNPMIQRIRIAKRPKQILRIVFDLTARITVPSSFDLPAQFHQNNRVVVDLKPSPIQKITQKIPRNRVIMLDPGHGGEDPGASGPRGTHEKDVVLKIAKALSRRINAESGMKAYLTRSKDYYVGLRQRLRLARKHRADLFISIHADAFEDRRSRGVSVYALSARGASSEAARWLAEKENASDLLGGVKLEQKEHILRSVLLDLSQTASIGASLNLGKHIIRSLSTFTKLHYPHVEQAGFVVLKSPDIPSILIETGFLSNLKEERNLRNTKYQNKLAAAILKGIQCYYQQHPLRNLS